MIEQVQQLIDNKRKADNELYDFIESIRSELDEIAWIYINKQKELAKYTRLYTDSSLPYDEKTYLKYKLEEVTEVDVKWKEHSCDGTYKGEFSIPFEWVLHPETFKDYVKDMDAKIVEAQAIQFAKNKEEKLKQLQRLQKELGTT